MTKSKPKSWSLKKIIKKSADVNLNTAIALSKSLLDEEKAKKRRAKIVDLTPYHLMKEPKEVENILNMRLNDIILQPFKIHPTNINTFKKYRIWDKTSLDFDIKPGDLSYDNINMSELMEYYVPALMPPICLTTVRMGDKIMSMSLIEGREKSFLFTNKEKVAEMEQSSMNGGREASFLFTETEKVPTIERYSINDDRFFNDNSFGFFDMGTSYHLSQDKDAPETLSPITVVDTLPATDTKPVDLKMESATELHRFMTMFNNSKHSDLFVLLKSGEIMFLHRFILAAWQCDEVLKDPQHFISDIDDEIVLKVFKHLYSDGKFNIDDIINTEDCLKVCKMFGIYHSSLVNHSNISKEYSRMTASSPPKISQIPKLPATYSQTSPKISQIPKLPATYLQTSPKISQIPGLPTTHSNLVFPSENDFSFVFPIQTKSESIPPFSTVIEPDTTNKNTSREKNDKFTDIPPNNLEVSDHFAIPEKNWEKLYLFSKEIIQSTPKHTCSTTRSGISPLEKRETPHHPNTSEEDLFGSMTQMSFLMEHDNIDQFNSNPLQVSQEDNHGIYEDPPGFELHNKLCLFTNERFNSVPIEVEPASDDYKEQFLIKPLIEYTPNLPSPKGSPLPLLQRIGYHNVNKYNNIEVDEVIAQKENITNKNLETQIQFNHDEDSPKNIEKTNLSFYSPVKSVDIMNSSSHDLEILNLQFTSPVVPLTKNLSSSNIENYNLSSCSPIPTLKKHLSTSNIENGNLSFSSTKSVNQNNSPLPLYKRIALNGIQVPKALVINISSDEEPAKDNISAEKTATNPTRSNNTKNSREKSEKKRTTRKSKDGEKNKIDKLPKLSKPKPERIASKKKSNNKLDYETPTKQQKIFNPFTPMPDYRSMPPEEIKGRCTLYGLKKSGNINIAEKLFHHYHQIDSGTDSDSSSSLNSSNAAPSLPELASDLSTDSKDKLEESLENNSDFYIFLKNTYFKDILTHTPLDVKQVFSVLKVNGTKTTLTKLNDYFDNQCILYCDSKSVKDNRYNRPMKASKMVM